MTSFFSTVFNRPPSANRHSGTDLPRHTLAARTEPFGRDRKWPQKKSATPRKRNPRAKLRHIRGVPVELHAPNEARHENGRGASLNEAMRLISSRVCSS